MRKFYTFKDSWWYPFNPTYVYQISAPVRLDEVSLNISVIIEAQFPTKKVCNPVKIEEAQKSQFRQLASHITALNF